MTNVRSTTTGPSSNEDVSAIEWSVAAIILFTLGLFSSGLLHVLITDSLHPLYNSVCENVAQGLGCKLECMGLSIFSLVIYGVFFILCIVVLAGMGCFFMALVETVRSVVKRIRDEMETERAVMAAEIRDRRNSARLEQEVRNRRAVPETSEDYVLYLVLCLVLFLNQCTCEGKEQISCATHGRECQKDGLNMSVCAWLILLTVLLLMIRFIMFMKELVKWMRSWDEGAVRRTCLRALISLEDGGAAR